MQPLFQQKYGKQAEINALLYQGVKADDPRIVALQKDVKDVDGKLYQLDAAMRRYPGLRDRNRITDLNGVSDNGDPVMTGDNIDSSNKVLAYQTGYAANSFYVYQQVYDKNGKPLEGVVVDRNGDGIISEADRYLYKSTMAPVTMGFSTRVEWKNFDLGFSLRASLGNYLYNNFEQGQRLKTTSAVWCQDSYLANRSVSSLGWLSDSNTSKLSDYFVQNASFLKMDNITLGYSFRKLFSSRLSGRISASVQNVFTITKYSGLDPETSAIDGTMWARPRTFSLGINLNF